MYVRFREPIRSRYFSRIFREVGHKAYTSLVCQTPAEMVIGSSPYLYDHHISFLLTLALTQANDGSPGVETKVVSLLHLTMYDLLLKLIAPRK